MLTRATRTSWAGGEELAAAGPGQRQRVVWQAGDVAVAEDVERLVAATVEQLGRIDVLVSNGGVYGPLGLIEDVDWAEWVKAIEINLLGRSWPAARSCRSCGSRAAARSSSSPAAVPRRRCRA